MHCKKCGKSISGEEKFCRHCGAPVETNESKENSTDVYGKTNDIIRCGECGYEGTPESARNPLFTALAWLCILFAPLITIIYFVGTDKYKCPKCQSTFLGIKNKDGKFSVGQKSAKNKPVIILVGVLVTIAIIGILSSIVLASLNTAREKAKSAQIAEKGWVTYHSVADKFSVLLPDYPKLDSKTGIDSGMEGITTSWHSFQTEVGGNTYFIYKYMYSEELNITGNEDKLLESYLNTMINSVAGNQLISSNYTYHSTNRALDFQIKNKDEYIKGRIIVVGQEQYLLMEDYPISNYSDADYNKFINSFIPD